MAARRHLIPWLSIVSRKAVKTNGAAQIAPYPCVEQGTQPLNYLTRRTYVLNHLCIASVRPPASLIPAMRQFAQLQPSFSFGPQSRHIRDFGRSFPAGSELISTPSDLDPGAGETPPLRKHRVGRFGPQSPDFSPPPSASLACSDAN